MAPRSQSSPALQARLEDPDDPRLRLGDVVYLRLEGRYLESTDAQQTLRRFLGRRGASLRQRFQVCPFPAKEDWEASLALDRSERPALVDGIRVSLKACCGFLGLREDESEPGRAEAKANFREATSVECGWTLHTVSRQEEVLDSRAAVLQNAASSEVLASDLSRLVLEPKSGDPPPQHQIALERALEADTPWPKQRVRMGDTVYVRLNDQYLASKKSGANLGNRQPWIVCPYASKEKEKEKAASAFKRMGLEDGDAICLMGEDGCYLGIGGKEDWLAKTAEDIRKFTRGEVLQWSEAALENFEDSDAQLLVSLLSKRSASGATLRECLKGLGDLPGVDVLNEQLDRQEKEDAERPEKETGRRHVRADFPCAVPSCAFVLRTANGPRQKQVLDGRGIFLQSLASSQMLAAENNHLSMQPKQPPGELRQIGFCEDHELVLERLSQPRWPSKAEYGGLGETEAPSPRTAAPATPITTLQRTKSSARLRRAKASPPPPEEAIRLGDTVYLRGDRGLFEVEGQAMRLAAGTSQLAELTVLPFMGAAQLADPSTDNETRKLANACTFRGRAVKDGDAICLQASTGCFVGISGTQADGAPGGAMPASALGRCWVRADFQDPAPGCAFVVHTTGREPQVLAQRAISLQSLASAQVLVAEEKVQSALMQPKNLKSLERAQLSFEKKAAEKRQVPPQRPEGRLLRWPEPHVRVRLPQEGEGTTLEAAEAGWVQVRWDQGGVRKHRVGAEGLYELVVVSMPYILVANAFGKTNGSYVRVGDCNGYPKFRQLNGDAIMYFEDHWRINARNDVTSWCYHHPSASTSSSSAFARPPLGAWPAKDDAEVPPANVSVMPAVTKVVASPARRKASALDALLQLPDDFATDRLQRALRLGRRHFPRDAGEVVRWAHAAKVKREEALECLAELAEEDDGDNEGQLLLLDGLPFLIPQGQVPEVAKRLGFPEMEALLFRSDEPLVLFLGSNLELQPHQTLEACFRFPSRLVKTAKEEPWAGRKRYGQCAGYLVQVDTGLLRQQRLKPSEALPHKLISGQFRCGRCHRVPLHSKEQTQQIQPQPRFFNLFGVAEVAVCLVVMDHSAMAHQQWTLVNYSMLTIRQAAAPKQS